MRATLHGLFVVAAASSCAHADVSAARATDTRVTGGTDKAAAPSFRVYGTAGEHRASPPAAAGTEGERAFYIVLQHFYFFCATG